MSRSFTPPPTRVTRAGTFDGMEKLFFENASAIEAGEITAPPEATSVPATPLKGWLVQLQNLALYQKIGLGLGAAVLIGGAVLVFGGKPAVQSHAAQTAAAKIEAPTPVPAKAAPSSAAAVEPPKPQKKYSVGAKRKAHASKRPLARSKPPTVAAKKTRR